MPGVQTNAVESDSALLFTIKAGFLCVVCRADASLWLDHLYHNAVSRKESTIYLY